ncbi:hypothetical protein E2C01_066595 [Portunus trituberculatus]|uniref:Uncharacterized protein n=1 Tax=Portunus trituberculatus TaxID=210409 RepID=A0A5B7HQX3_PORTR|nr:hypothetical protein [Portunus trituberculatus]
MGKIYLIYDFFFYIQRLSRNKLNSYVEVPLYNFSLLQFFCFDCYSHYFHFVLTILSQTIISTPFPPSSFLSLLQLLNPFSLKLT